MSSDPVDHERTEPSSNEAAIECPASGGGDDSPGDGPVCTGDCHQCGIMPDNPDPPLKGVRFSIASAIAFVLPILAAGVGGFVMRGSADRCLVGVLLGGGLGVGTAWLLSKGLYRDVSMPDNKHDTIVQIDETDTDCRESSDRSRHE